MKLGIVGPALIVDKIRSLINKEFPSIHPTAYLYTVFTETPKLIQDQQQTLDAILFAGETLLAYTEHSVKPLIPWDFIPRSTSSLLQVLLKIALSNKYSIYRISSDLYDQDQLAEVYQELGVSQNQIQIFTVNKSPFEEDYIHYVCTFHEQQYRNHQATCCITALYNVYEKLTAKNIPCFCVEPSVNIIRHTLNKLQLHHLMQLSQETQLVVLAIRIDAPSEYSVFFENEYQYNIEKSNVSKQIFLFAKRLQAAVVETGRQEFLLFSTKKALEDATAKLENIVLLEMVKKNTASTVSIGIGYGPTAQEAKYCANFGMEKAGRLGGDTAFIVYNHDKIIGPIQQGSTKWQVTSDTKVDQRLLTVAEKSGISLNIVFELYSIVKREGRTRFTAAELASLSGVTIRTANRLLRKLETHGFCFEVGKRVMTQAGRPSRIIELCFP